MKAVKAVGVARVDRARYFEPNRTTPAIFDDVDGMARVTWNVPDKRLVQKGDHSVDVGLDARIVQRDENEHGGAVVGAAGHSLLS